MSSPQDKGYLFDRPGNVQRVIRGLVIVCIVLMSLDLIVHRHVNHPWEEIFGFYALYGFVACVLLVLLAAEMRKLIMRGEDYYQRDTRSTSGDNVEPDDD